MTVTVIVPTVKGRERYLEECLASYAAHTTDYELHVIVDRETCGQAWVDGADKAEGDWIHFSADDLQPFAGWSTNAVHVAKCGLQPAPRILNGQGELETCGGTDGFTELPTGHRTDFSRIPFLSKDNWWRIRDDVAPLLARTHYYTDNAVSVALARIGVGTAVHRGYSFVHHWAQERRGAGMSEPDRMRHDHDLFVAWARTL